MSPALRSHFAEYAQFHRTTGNQACHYLGIPLIVIAIFGMLARVPLGLVGGLGLTLAEVVLVAASIYYLTLDSALAALMLLAFVAMDGTGHFLPFAWAVALFVVGWIAQFVGHYVYEKRSPAFFRNGTHLLVGPLWILAKATGRD